MLLPNEFIENCIETYIYSHSTRSQKIYWVVLIAVAAALVSLPFIYVDISVKGSGVIRPIAEKTEIIAPITELVDSVYVREGAKVEKGDVILRLRTNNSEYKVNYQSNRIAEYESHLADLAYLAKGNYPAHFRSAVRKQEHIYFIKRKRELETALDKANKDYERNKQLFEKKVISEEEYEGYYYQLETQKNELASLQESQLSSWQAELDNYRNLHQEINTSLKQEIKDQDLYIIKSPVSGTVDQFSGIYRGSTLQTGQSVAVVSPDSLLYLEVYVTPRNIGYITEGMPVNVQVESFNYNEWGTIKGEVKEISSDFLTDGNGNSFYKVKCWMQRDFLTLKNGRIGKLKKGMNVNAHFMITRQSLFNILYQKMDDWVNPTQYSDEYLTGTVNK